MNSPCLFQMDTIFSLSGWDETNIEYVTHKMSSKSHICALWPLIYHNPVSSWNNNPSLKFFSDSIFSVLDSKLSDCLKVGIIRIWISHSWQIWSSSVPTNFVRDSHILILKIDYSLPFQNGRDGAKNEQFYCVISTLCAKIHSYYLRKCYLYIGFKFHWYYD